MARGKVTNSFTGEGEKITERTGLGPDGVHSDARIFQFRSEAQSKHGHVVFGNRVSDMSFEPERIH